MPVVHFPVMATSHVAGQNQAATLPSQVKNEPPGQSMVHPPSAPPAHSHHSLPVHQVSVNNSLPYQRSQQNKAHSSVSTGNPATKLLKPKEEPVAKDPIDIASIRGLFGWATIDGVNVPHLLREDKKYVAVRIVEQKLLSRFPNTFPEDLGEHEPLVSYYVTQNELKLLDEINCVHCNYDYGHQPFTNKDLIVKLSEFENFYNLVKRTFPEEVLESRKIGIPLMKPAELARSKSGWIQVNNTVTPYFRRDNVKYVVLQIIKHAAKLLQNIEVPSILPNEEEYKLINDMCKGAGVAFQFAKNTRLLSLDDVKRHHKVTLRELPSDKPKDYAEFIGDSNSNEENKNSAPSVPMTLSQQNPVGAPLAGPVVPTFPPQQNGAYGVNHSNQHIQSSMGVQPHITPMPIQRYPFGGQHAVNTSVSGQYSTRNVTPRGVGQQQFPSYPIRTPMMAQNQIPINQQQRPPLYPGFPQNMPGNPGLPQNMPGNSEMHRQNFRLPRSQVALAEFLNKRNAMMQNRRMPAPSPQASDQNLYPSATRSTSSSQSALRNTAPNVSAGIMPGVMAVSGSQPSFIPNTAQGLMPPRITTQNLQQRPINPAQVSMVQALQNQISSGQQSAQFLMPIFSQPQMGTDTMPRMNNILQRPPFQASLPIHHQQTQGTVNNIPASAQVAPAPPHNNTVLLKQALSNQQGTNVQQPSSMQSFQQSPLIHIAPKAAPTIQPAVTNTYLPKTPTPAPTQTEKMTSATWTPPVQQSSVVPNKNIDSMDSNRVPPLGANQMPAEDSNPIAAASPGTAVSVKTSPASAKSSPTVSSASTKPVAPEASLSPSTPSESKPDAQKIPVTTEAAEVIKISTCVSGVRFEGKSISCLEYDNLPGKHALVEAVSKLYFPQCTLNEFLFVLEQVLCVPTTACQPNEEKAFIHYYRLPVPVLKCNKMVKLEDLSKYFPQLNYTFSKKNSSHKNKADKEIPKQPNTTASVVVPDDDDNSAVIFLDETGPDQNVEKRSETSASSAAIIPSKVRPSGAAKRKHYSGSGQPCKQPRRLEDAVERLKQKPEASAGVHSDKTTNGTVVNNKPSTQPEEDQSVIVIE